MSDSDETEPPDSLLAAVARIPERAPPVSASRADTLALAGEEAPVGTQIGRYVLGRRLGAGGMGVVWEAVDPELERRVAIKLLRTRQASDSSPSGLAERLRGEAQALARLSHPNVVAVHDVGIDGGDLYIVMQLVDGTTLDLDLRARPRSAAEIVARFVAAGRGLAAAHAASIVHRDFKPTNVLVGRDGSIRVSDFGLARDLETRDAEESATLVGTPAYMAPEQFTARPVTPASDQFAFCIALWEALYGERPFRGTTIGELAEAITTGKRADPPAGRSAPRWLHAAVVRGLAVDPGARWPSMQALVDTLESVPRRRRRTLAGTAMLGALAIASGATWLAASRGTAAPKPTCDTAAAPLANVWDAARRDRVHAHLVAVDRAQGEARFAATAPLLDGYAAAWQAASTDACHANRIAHVQSDALFDRRMSCLDRRLGDLASVAGLLADAPDLAAVDRALVAAHQLPELAACADRDALMAALPLPDDPARRRAVAAADADILAVEHDRVLGKLHDLDAHALAAVEAARATSYPPVLARALHVRAGVLGDTQSVVAHAGVLRELADVAAQAHDDATATWAWSQLLAVVGSQLDKPAEALALLPAARAALLRAGDGTDARVDFLFAESAVLIGDQRADEAHAAIGEATKLLEAAGAGTKASPRTPRLADMVFQSGTLFAMAGKYALAEPEFRRAIALYTLAFGADHPEVAFGWTSLGQTLREEGKDDDALAAYREAIRIRAARLGDSVALASTYVTLATTLVDLNRAAEAAEPIEHALAILRGGGWDSELATALMMKAYMLDGLDKHDEAHAVLDESIALFDRLGGVQPDLPNALNNRGNVWMEQEKWERALEDFTRAADVLTKTRGASHPMLVEPLVNAATCQLELHRAADALPLLDRALAIHAEGAAGTLGTAKCLRGRALAESGKDKTGGLEAATAARAELAALGPDQQSRVDDCDKWLRIIRRAQ